MRDGKLRIAVVGLAAIRTPRDFCGLFFVNRAFPGLVVILARNEPALEWS